MKERIFDAEFLKKLESLVINSIITMSEGSGGNRKSRSKGSSVEFSDFREYSSGDDFRRIDWNAFGRFDRLFVKLFMEEREALVNVFIDCSKSMSCGTPSKSVYSLKLAGVLAFLALSNMDRVSINALYQNNLKQSSIVTGKNMFDRCISFLEELEFTGETAVCGAVKRKDIKNKGISFIISDFFSADGIEAAVRYLLYKNQDVVLIHVLSPEELKPAMDGQVRLLDSETRDTVDIAVTPVLMKQYEKALSSFISNIKELSSRMGAAYVLLSTADSIEKAVLEDFVRTGIIR
ncbi:MAG: DUF58 domain-containing protein [Bacillota bacterium]